ncbi:MAG: hypothetical protein U0837_08660 [Dehalococcoidia bacterium]
MGLRTTQMLGTFFDGVTPPRKRCAGGESFEIGFRETIRRRDGPFRDYGERREQGSGPSRAWAPQRCTVQRR